MIAEKRTVSLRVFSENATFNSAYSPKTHNFASSLNPLYTAESAQFYYAFLQTTISLTPCFCQKREVWFRFFAENAQNDPKTLSYEDSTKFNSPVLAMLSHASCCFVLSAKTASDQKLWISVWIWRKCWLDCLLYLLVTEICKKKFKNRLWKSCACVPLNWAETSQLWRASPSFWLSWTTSTFMFPDILAVSLAQLWVGLDYPSRLFGYPLQEPSLAESLVRGKEI